MIVAQEPTQSLAAANRPLAAAVRVPGKQQDVFLPLVIPLGVQVVSMGAQRSPKRITFDRRPSLTDLTQRSA